MWREVGEIVAVLYAKWIRVESFFKVPERGASQEESSRLGIEGNNKVGLQ